MQIKKPKSSTEKSYIDSDFASILEEGRFDRIKPFLKGFLVLAVLIVTVGGGVYAYSNFKSSEQSGEAASVDSYEDSEQAKCIAEVYEQHKAPDESDPEFYPKLIAGYDAHLACYDKYPDENNSSNRLSIESARQSAIDASGDYKDTYLSSNSYDYSSNTNPVTSSRGTSSRNDGDGAYGGSSTTENTSRTPNQPSAPSEWELNKAEFDRVVACADQAATNNPVQGAYGSPSYYQQKVTQLEAQLTCTNSAKYSISQQRRASYQSQIATNKARYNDSINPNSPSYYPNSY